MGRFWFWTLKMANQTGQIIWNYYKVICVQSKKGDKNC